MNNCRFLDQLQAYLFGLKMQRGDMHTVCGDMNVDVSKSISDSLNLENSLLLFGLKVMKIGSTRKTKNSQSSIEEIWNNFHSIVIVQHNSLSDHEAVEIEATFLTEDKTLLKKQNLELLDNWNVLENHEIFLKFIFPILRVERLLFTASNSYLMYL